jgi:hypothetical protein
MDVGDRGDRERARHTAWRAKVTPSGREIDRNRVTSDAKCSTVIPGSGPAGRVPARTRRRSCNGTASVTVFKLLSRNGLFAAFPCN